jgi:hypothetical protein
VKQVITRGDDLAVEPAPLPAEAKEIIASSSRDAPKMRWWQKRDQGSATAEFSIVLPAVVVLALLVLSLGRAVLVHVDCQDAARAGAREIATAQGFTSQVRQKALTAAEEVSAGSRAVFQEKGNQVRVDVSCNLLPGPMGIFPAVVHGEAVAIKQESHA